MRNIVRKGVLLALSSFLCFVQFQVVLMANDNITNLAYQKQVTYSDVEGGKVNGAWKYPQFVGEKAVDGVSGKDSRWSAGKTDDQWLIVDLGKEYAIDTISIDFHALSPDYSILLAGEDQSFTLLHNEVNELGKTAGITTSKAHNASGTKARFVKYQQNKMWAHTNGQSYGSSISELRISEFKEVDIEENSLRIGTFNIAANKKFDINKQRELTSQYGLEVVGLQEVDRFTQRNNFDMLESFKGDVYASTYYSKAIDHEGGAYGIGTVSKYPLSDSSTTFVKTQEGDESRVYQRSVLEKSGKKIAFYNTHLSYESMDIRKQQMEQLKLALKNDPIEYKIVVGDFNVDQYHSEWNIFLDDLNMCNGYKGTWYDTFNGVDATMKVNSVDNILVTRNLTIDEVVMVPTSLSDHNLFVAQVTFENEMKVSKEWLRTMLEVADTYNDPKKYTKTSYDCLEKVRQEAKDLYISSLGTTQAVVNAKVIALQGAMDSLEYVNLAYNKVVDFSGVEGGEVNGAWKYPQFVGDKVVDGIVDSASRWSADKTDTQWVSIDLGKVRNISEVLIHFHAESPNYEVQVSKDGVNYTSIYHDEEGTQGDTVMRQISFAPQDVRYVKYVQNKMWKHSSNGKFYGSSISEIEVFEGFLIENITLAEISDVVSKDEEFKLKATILPTLAQHKEVVYSSNDSSVASVDAIGEVKALSAGTTTLKIASKENPSIFAEKTITVVNGPIKAMELRFESSQIELTSRDKRYLTYAVYPKNAINQDIAVTWSSSNPEVVSVNQNGLIQAHAKGDAIIRVVSKEDANVSGSLQVSIKEPTYSANYDIMKDRWIRRVVGENLNMEDEDIRNYVENIDQEADKLWSSMHKEEGRTTLWDKLASDTVSADYTTQFTKIKKIALAYGIEGTSLYQNKELLADIVGAIDFMVVNKKYNGIYSTGNWWDWQIGCTQPLVDTLMIISDYTEYSDIDKAVKSIEGYAKKPSTQWPSYTATGANRTDIGLSVLGSAILAKSDARMNLVKSEVPDVMKLVTSGDGLYKDGSLIQHTKHAYTGSYGNELLKGVGKIQSIITGTQFDIVDERMNNVYNTILNGYIPLMHKGQMMSMVNGRSISRAPGTNPFTTEFEAGSETISNVMLIAQFAPEEYRGVFLSAIKGWLEVETDDFDFFAHARDFDALLDAKAILEDETITSSTYNGMQVYGSMDRVVQVKDDYSVGLSMYSSRIYNYEFGNTENKKGWHTGSGVLYLYNNDLKQYGEGYWPTIDPYRLPGTTVDTKELTDGAGNNKTSPQSWVGGASDGENGVSAMFYNSTNTGLGMDLKAQKSWFFFDGKIVALGAGINGTSDDSIETTVENRMLTGKNNTVSLNGSTWNADEEDKNLKSGDYVHLQGTGTGNDIGYYFLEDSEVTMQKEERTGKYADINSYFVNDKTYTNTFFKMGVNHGNSAVNDTYEYVLLPGYTKQEMNDYASNNTVEVIRNDAEVQALRDTKTGEFAFNNWTESTISVEGISVNNSASVYTKTKDGVLRIAISDPKQKNVKLTLTVDAYDEIISKDESVTVNDDGSFTIDTMKSAGASHEIVLKVESISKVQLESALEKAKVISTQENKYTKSSFSAFMDAYEIAQEVYKDSFVKQEHVDEVTLTLEKSMEALAVRASKESLAQLQTAKGDLESMEDGYSKQEFAIALENIEKANTLLQMSVEEVMQKQVDELLSIMIKEKENLLVVTANKEVKIAISLAQNILQSDSVNTIKPKDVERLKKAVADATTLVEASDITLSKLKDAKEALLSAIQKLEKRADKTSLQGLIADAKTLVENNYTTKSWGVLATALQAAIKVANDSNVSGITVSQAQQTLFKAIKGLEVKYVPLPPIKGDGETTKPKEDKKEVAKNNSIKKDENKNEVIKNDTIKKENDANDDNIKKESIDQTKVPTSKLEGEDESNNINGWIATGLIVIFGLGALTLLSINRKRK